MSILGTISSIAFPSVKKSREAPKNANFFDIANIRSSLNDYSVQKASLANILLYIPPCISTNFKGFDQEYYSAKTPIQMYADSFNVPGGGLATTEVRRYGEGAIEKYAYAPINVDINVSFIVDGRGIIQKFFYTWLNEISRNNSRQFTGDLQESSFPFEVSYKNEPVGGYGTELDLYSYDEAGIKSTEYKLHSVFPVFVSDVQYNWSNTDLARLNVTLTYSYYEASFYKSQGASREAAKIERPQSLLQTAVKAVTAVQTISTFRKPRSVADVLNVTNNTASILNF